MARTSRDPAEPMPGPAQNPLWVVTGVSSSTVLTPTGVMPGKIISYMLADGQNGGKIQVPDSDFTPAKVGQLLHDAAMRLIGVLTLTGPEMVSEAPGELPFTPYGG